jgi:kynurenine formamidase
MTGAEPSLVATLQAADFEVIDLSASIATSPPEVGEWQRTDLVYRDHEGGAEEMEERFGVPRRLLRNEEGPAVEHIARLTTHNTTHIDAPFHYNSEIQGAPARTIDELPLEWFVGPGVVLDVVGRPEDEPLSVHDVVESLDKAEHDLKPGDIVLVKTGSDEFYSQPDYPSHGPGVSPEATLWLYDKGIRVMGIDAWGWDAAIAKQAAIAVPRDEPGIVWGAHQIDREYAQIERLVNLDSLPLTGFSVVCMPLKIERGSAGPTRAVAIVPKQS